MTDAKHLTELYRTRQAIDTRCASDPLFWLQHLTKTTDPHAAAKGVEPLKPFPQFDYFKEIFYFLMRPKDYPRVFIVKSREMMLSWCIAGYGTWLAMWNPGTQVLVMSEKEEKSVRLIGYGKSLYDLSPNWLREMHKLRSGHTKTRPGRDKELQLEFANGSEIIGVPSGPNQIRSFHASCLLMDEVGTMPNAETSFNTAHPVTRQIIGIGSAYPGWWADVASENSIDPVATAEFVEKMNKERPEVFTNQ